MDRAEPALLVVDDNEDNRYTLVQRLRRQGYTQLSTANNGREALERLAAQPFDLMLLDVTMPEMNGYEVLERVKADPRLRQLPVIMISALDQIDSVVRCIELGAEDYLPKPFNPTLLKARVGATLEKKRLRDAVDAYLARIEQELAWARRIQLGMVPDRFPAPTPQYPVELFGTLRPARQIGGDLYDYFWRDEHTLCLVIADVSDKGAAAALFMARTKTLVHMVGTMLFASAGQPAAPHEVAARVNEELCLDNGEGMFVTLLLATIDLQTRKLRYCNAGHPAPFVVDAAGQVLRLEQARGKPLGIRASFTYDTAEHSLAPGDTFVLYTDGITEAEDGKGALFGDERLRQALHGLGGAGAEATVRTVINQVQAFVGAATQSDDIAALAARLPRTPQSGGGIDTAEIAIENRLAELRRVARLVDDLGLHWHLPADTIADLQVALDEILTNIVSYAYDDAATHRIGLSLSRDEAGVHVVVEDDGKPFDPFSVAAPDHSGGLRERRVGGLGIHLVRALMNMASYDRHGDINRTTLLKSLRPQDPAGEVE